MPEYARVDGSTVLEFRTMDPPPPHKAHLWRDVVREGDGPVENRIVESNVVRIVRTDIPLDTLKAQLKNRIDSDAETARLLFITGGSGKAMSYQEKLSEARLVLEDEDQVVDPALVPIMAAEANARGITILQAAQLIHQTYLGFKQVEAVINATTISAKQSISDASDAAAARAAYEAIAWPSIP